MKKILFRGDAAPDIGTGDLVTLRNLQESIQSRFQDWEFHYMARDFPAARNLLRGYHPDNIFFLPPDCTQEHEESCLKHYTSKNGIAMLIFEITWKRLSAYNLEGIGAKIAVVDFFGDVRSDCDLLINWDVDAPKKYSPSEFPRTRFLLGQEYVVLPPSFDFSEVAKRNHLWPPQNILITMGGNDERGLTSRIARDLFSSKAGTKVNCTAIIGVGAGCGKELKDFSKYHPITVKTGVKDLFQEYMVADFAFSAGGVTAFELVASKTPCALIACYEHQEERCAWLAEQGWAFYFGTYSKIPSPIFLPEKMPNAFFKGGFSSVGSKFFEISSEIGRILRDESPQKKENQFG